MKLFPHNQEAYDSAVHMFKQEKRVCIIHPTGTGKSVIIAEFVNQNPSKRHLLLAPGTHIFSEIKKHLGKVEMSVSTYTGLKRNGFLFVRNSFDHIYLDEFHRLGANVWGSAVARLLKLNPRAKVLGTSATPIRYLDDNRNMAKEIFHDRIASQMSLVSAIANRVLPTPIYVSALYSVQEEFQRMKNKLLSSELKNKETFLKDLDSKVIDWEKSSGLDAVMTKHLGRERRRVIVFCKDWDHLQSAQKLLDPIFIKIYGRFQSLSLYSKRKMLENETSLQMFRSENKSAIVLYTIDKVNEGLHSKTCNTVILLRDTISANVFYQQIGRAFSTAPTNRPLIIDLVNNFRNVNLVPLQKDFEQELDLSARDNTINNGEKRKETVLFIDETQDIRKIFSSLNDEMDVWNRFYGKAKAHFSEYGHPYVHFDKEFKKWIGMQATDAKIGTIGKERLAKLRAIGMYVDITACWMFKLIELREWIRKNGVLPNKIRNHKLYAWMFRQKENFKHGRLTREQIKILQDLFSLEGEANKRMDNRVKRLIRHFKNGYMPPGNCVVRRDLLVVRAMYREKTLSQDILTKLRNANVPVGEPLKHSIWIRKVRRLVAWYKEKGRLPRYSEDLPLGQFCALEKSRLGRVHPYAAFIERNKDIKLLFERFQNIIKIAARPDWEQKYSELKGIAKLHGRISQGNCKQYLIRWIWRQRRALRNGKLSAEQIKKLLLIKEVNWRGIEGRDMKKGNVARDDAKEE